MADKQPCHCIPTCLKVLGPRQRLWQCQAVEAALAIDSSESDGQEQMRSNLDQEQAISNPDNDHGEQAISNHDYDHGFEDTGLNGQMDVKEEAVNTDDSSTGDSSDSSTDSSDVVLPPANAALNIEDEEADSTEEDVEDGITDENLIQVLQECFGDEWEQQLHSLLFLQLL
ncbi:hypothetical protein JB92DRAFT_3132483 [Gautieria morchelliformis]|nr:hypothetical protein JB92DRAFT_3132483 [Gautieria morchelliformis]